MAGRPGRPRTTAAPLSGVPKPLTDRQIAERGRSAATATEPEEVAANLAQDYAAERAKLAEEIREGVVAAPSPPPVVQTADDKADAAINAKARKEYESEVKALNRARTLDLQAQAEWAAKKRKGLPPVSALPLIKRIDPTVVIDSDGKRAGTPGYLLKHVALLDTNGREVDRNKTYAVSQHVNDGYRIVKDRVTGEEINTPFGLVMEISPKDAARREFAYAGAASAVNPEEFFAAQAEMESTPGYLKIRREESHGRHTSGSLDD